MTFGPPPTYEQMDPKLRERMSLALRAWIADVGSGNNPDPLQQAATDVLDLYERGAFTDDWHVAMMKLRLSVKLKAKMT